eukprot:TRINITY_DN1799_c0_g1_i2.p1 TRINITY_DN1799_c0_g1~~TRINITY_DN1799_c0_g1_i2.p1  ORF type:complete len:1902 (+),score=314.24 TRINITY_DN1799_c0_g1_i2:62-5767(+)
MAFSIMVAFCWLVRIIAASAACGKTDVCDSSFMLVQIQSRASQTTLQDEIDQIETNSRNRSQDARFLLQATFGPTREGLEHLGKMTYTEWIQEQIALPLESHREYYRSRVNPHFEETRMSSVAGYSMRSPCSKGARWNGFAFVLRDVGKSIKYESGQIFVDGDFRTNVDAGLLPSRWARHGMHHGYICSVVEAPAGDVTLAATDSCRKDEIVHASNPEIWLADTNQAVTTSLIFERLKPGILLLSEESLGCELSNASWISVDGHFYRFDARLKLLENTLQNPTACVPKNFLNMADCQLNLPGVSACLSSCGSPGEVANNPAKGHQLPMFTKPSETPDMDYDNKYVDRLYNSLSKSTVWTMKAMQANDQLRQRMAWALSQIFVVSVPGVGDDGLSEMWMNYYDIFVRHAFGNFRDILREVTYSPLMGKYLTYTGSSSFANNGMYPDENYAREIMQLFTIGLDKLYLNGTCQKDKENNTLPTYSNEHIMDFARVFTGFLGSPFRQNIEIRQEHDNFIDPMMMNANRHDVYPKPDLDGNYLGDGYPLCADLPRGAFLVKGAKYEFLGYTYTGDTDVFLLDSSSFLRAELCGASSGECAFKLGVELGRDLECTGTECEVDTLRIIRVADGFYEYVPEPCVHMFFYNGQEVVKGDYKGSRRCANPDTHVAGASCCGGCSDVAPAHLQNNFYTCSNYTKLDSQCNLNDWWTVKQYCQMSCWQQGLGYGEEQKFANNCTRGDYSEARLCGRHDERMRLSSAEALCKAQNMDICPGKTEAGALCNYTDSWVWTSDACNVDIEVHAFGKISGHATDSFHNKFTAAWLGNPPPVGTYATAVELRQVFDELPSREELQNKLKIGAFPPRGACSVCTNDVKAYPAKSATTYMQTVLASSPVAYWQLDDESGVTAVTAAGNSVLDATYIRAPLLAEPRLLYSTGSSVSFAGTSRQAVWPPDSDLINLGTYNAKTVELWFKAESFTSSRSLLWAQGGTSRGLNMYLEGSTLVMNAWNIPESNWGPVSVNATVEAGKEYHIALVLDGNPDGQDDTNDGTLSGFINGISFGSASGSGVLRRHTGRVCMAGSRSGGLWADGSRFAGGEAYFTGSLDEVAIYNAALSPETLRAHYEAAMAPIDRSTIFEVKGKFYKNVESIVKVNGTHEFRNPPVFMLSGAFDTEDVAGAMQAERASLTEVEALLDHLFYHPNTPAFIGKKLIQRFVTSNPTPSYVEAVARAFQSGQHAGVAYSGKYGDLGALLAAILLHDEARMEGASAQRGALREPLLKIIHFMRAMGYAERGEDQIVLDRLQDVIGQFPYQSPSVFNFYMADFEPPSFSEAMSASTTSTASGPGPEPEPEPEPVAPEFQIFTPPYFINWLNGMESLIHDGVSHPSCGSGGGLGIYIDGSINKVCPRGEYGFQELATVNDTLEELDVLLTGGRLTSNSEKVLQSVYAAAAEGDALQDAQLALVLMPEFHTMGPPLPLPNEPRAVEQIVDHPETKPYRATVMLFFFGGADTFNMLVPQECELYNDYVQVRADVALKPWELITIDAPGQACSKFGIHASLKSIKALYDEGSAAFVSNVGALSEPITDIQFKEGSKATCLGLFSHSHQQNAAQTLKCQTHGASPRGAGGRLADMLAAGTQQFRTASFSLAGTSIWSQGNQTHVEIIDRDRGAVRFGSYERWRKVISNITSQQYGSLYSQEYTRAFFDAIESSESIGAALDGVELSTAYQTGSRLEKQLYQVARLIKARDLRRAERDFFFVELGGWDTHSSVKATLQDKFTEVDRAIHGFVTELKAQEIFDSVVLVTESDFGRTLTSNGGGTDHGWAGNHLVVGGSIQGRKIFNEYPKSLLEGNGQDAGRGRLIPKYPWESMMVPIAEWMGLEPGQRHDVFPNLVNFNDTYIIQQASLFKP